MTRINYDLLQELATKPHPLLNIADDLEAQVRETPIAWTGEVFQEARTAHHLLDLVGIPHQAEGHYSSDLDARTWLAINELITLRGQLDRIVSWHSRETADGGMVGDYCNECGHRWPCETRRMADGTHEDLAEQALTDSAPYPTSKCGHPVEWDDDDFGCRGCRPATCAGCGTEIPAGGSMYPAGADGSAAGVYCPSCNAEHAPSDTGSPAGGETP